jgi:hypothetical protein
VQTGRRTSAGGREQSYVSDETDRPWDGLGQDDSLDKSFFQTISSWLPFAKEKSLDLNENDVDDYDYDPRFGNSKQKTYKLPMVILFAIVAAGSAVYTISKKKEGPSSERILEEIEIVKPDFVFEHPYISSSYYTSTKSLKTLQSVDKFQVQPKKNQLAGKKVEGEKDFTRDTQTRLAILRPFCAFDAGPLPTTFDCWQSFPPCKVAAFELGGEFDEDMLGYNDENKTFDDVGSHMQKNAKADVFLFYSQTFSENEVAIKAVDKIIDQYFEGGGWAQCFDNIYAVEANIPADLDNYIPPMQEYLYNWVNGPNRQFEAGFRIIQSGEWGNYDGFYLMEGDSIPIKSYWLDVVLSEIEMNRPFAIMGA